MNYIKTFESYSGINDYIDEIFNFLKKEYNLFPEQIRYLRDVLLNGQACVVNHPDANLPNWHDEVEECYNDNTDPREFAKKIASELQLSDDGLMQYKMTGGNQWQNIYYK